MDLTSYTSVELRAMLDGTRQLSPQELQALASQVIERELASRETRAKGVRLQLVATTMPI